MLEIYKSSLFSLKRIPAYLLALSIIAVFTILIIRNWTYINPALTIFNRTSTKTATVVEEPSVFAEKLQPIYADATELEITNLNIHLQLVNVGVADDGSLETPKNWDQGGWFDNGARPGENGNMIINAHYDDNYGRPAAFWSLKNIKAGDTVLVKDEFGKEYTYKVTDIVYVDINDPARLEVFASDKSIPSITLITCGGVWQPGIHTYSKRLVVKGILI
ncbi:MAG TPA: class F sortase [Candidatus Saccharimonadales bacterium]|nr:class F sortase [Candidatus Saccharimonadales bacterium]